ncbi:type I restriction-modification system subunit M N-terminal domain-containing protein [Roseovarius sp. S1116L3]|uniref:type I restriction-modification system subunit M N-terminal domain-containing protein n=1 Tax=Roseovarius roseus TaxID=3342636 RepID=UPI00372B3BBC
MSTAEIESLGSLVWSISELLRGDFKKSEYGNVIGPFVAQRRLDRVLEETKLAILDMARRLPGDMSNKRHLDVVEEEVGT